MTIEIPAPWVCSACGAENMGTMWQSVNVTVNPELAERILDGSLFAVRCQQCSRSGYFNYSVHFHDMERHHYYFYHSPREQMTQRDRESFEDMSQQFGPAYLFRHVYDPNHFLEMVRIWHDDLDDMAMLCFRLLLGFQVEQAQGVYPILLQYQHRIAGPEVKFAYTVLLTEDSEPMAMMAPAYLYANLLPKVEQLKPRFFPGGKWIDWTKKTASQLLPYLS